MENKKKIHGRVRGEFLAKPPVIDLNSEKKDEILKDFFNKKAGGSAIIPKRAPIKISKLERVALPVLIIAAVLIGWSIVFNIFFYKTKIDFKEQLKLSIVYLINTTTKSASYLRGDFEVLSAGPSLDLSAGIGFLGDKIADIAEFGSLKTVSLIEGLNKI